MMNMMMMKMMTTRTLGPPHALAVEANGRNSVHILLSFQPSDGDGDGDDGEDDDDHSDDGVYLYTVCGDGWIS